MRVNRLLMGLPIAEKVVAQSLEQDRRQTQKYILDARAVFRFNNVPAPSTHHPRTTSIPVLEVPRP